MILLETTINNSRVKHTPVDSNYNQMLETILDVTREIVNLVLSRTSALLSQGTTASRHSPIWYEMNSTNPHSDIMVCLIYEDHSFQTKQVTDSAYVYHN